MGQNRVRIIHNLFTCFIPHYIHISLRITILILSPPTESIEKLKMCIVPIFSTVYVYCINIVGPRKFYILDLFYLSLTSFISNSLSFLFFFLNFASFLFLFLLRHYLLYVLFWLVFISKTVCNFCF